MNSSVNHAPPPLRIAAFPGRYVQGPQSWAQFGQYVKPLASQVLLLMDQSLPEALFKTLDCADLQVTERRVAGECSYAAIDRETEFASAGSFQAIAAFGGGKIIDLGRAVADRLDLRFISVPTIAASDAPCSALAVVYNDAGQVVEDLFVRRNPDLVLVDSAIIAAAPARFFSAGIGDALATFYEADACRKSGANNVCGAGATGLAHAVARLCLDTLLSKGEQALADCRNNHPSDAFEDVLEATLLLSGVGFESGGVAAAHAIHHGIASLAESHGALHGEKVAYGVLVELALNAVSDEQLLATAEFNTRVALPVRLNQLGVTASDAAIAAIAERACRPGEIIYNEAVEITPQRVEQALRRVEELGKTFTG